MALLRIAFSFAITLLFSSPIFAQTQSTDSFSPVGVSAEPAEYIVGINEFSKYVSDHIIYPKELSNTKIEGTIHVYFEVDTNGVIDNVRIIKGINEILDNEAIRVVKASPHWKPAMQGSKRVRVRYRIPVKIKPPETE